MELEIDVGGWVGFKTGEGKSEGIPSYEILVTKNVRVEMGLRELKELCLTGMDNMVIKLSRNFIVSAPR